MTAIIGEFAIPFGTMIAVFGGVFGLAKGLSKIFP